MTEDIWNELRRQTERLEQLHTKLEAVKAFAQEMAPSYMSQRILEILENEAQ